MKQNIKSKQAGASFTAMLAFLVLLGFSLKFIVPAIGMHWDDRVLESILDDLPEVINRDSTVQEVRKLIYNRLHINSMRSIPMSELAVTKHKGQIQLTWQYERREHVMSNVDIALTFNHEYSY